VVSPAPCPSRQGSSRLLPPSHDSSPLGQRFDIGVRTAPVRAYRIPPILFFNPSGRNLAGRCIRPGPDGGGVAAGGSAGVAGRRGEARAAGARGGRKEARRGRGGQPPDGGGGADDGAAHQGPPRRVPRLRVQAQGELEVRGFDTLSPFFFILASMGGSDPSLLVMAFCHDSRGGVVLDVRAVVLLFFSSLRMFEH
jgi:hypothetical protein